MWTHGPDPAPQHLSTASGELQADASFMQTLWNMNPVCSGGEEGYVTGGHVMRLFHGHMDECLTTSAPEQGEERRFGGPRGVPMSPPPRRGVTAGVTAGVTRVPTAAW
ncbi:hypothetical protein AV530_014697 [Patagioenas fasciata monilis]|uniref:MIR domain-containing protein n=1 Tax=Patagioenas fasciata monilis TaxID=372326 RepID=A0A1V4J2K1_PATFA|nr:hypothetical protein AV530_014697 [Patagioenas fasciata monilis]